MYKLLILALCAITFCQALTPVELAANDVVALNYALTLENLEATFYSTYLATFTPSDFSTAGYNATVYSYITLIKNHELAHVLALSQAVTALGGTPVDACNYTFPVTSVADFVAVARALENTGVAAYDGAINSINDLSLRIAAASIATVEARHAAYLNDLLGQVPFPSSFDNATAPSVIISMVSEYIDSCDYTPQAPKVAAAECNGASNLTNPNVTTIVSFNNRSFLNASALSQDQLAQNDIVALNYALTLENLEATFYNTFLANFTEADFIAANFTATTYSYFKLIQAHENAHVSTLSSAVTNLGGTPVPACNYSFPVTTVSDFVTVARVLENTGVNAYDGAIETINDLNLRTAAASIATVEARHAAYLNELLNAVPFPDLIDNATQPTTIAAQISPFLVNCPYTIALPKPALSACLNETSSTSGTTSASTTDSGSGAGLLVPSSVLLIASVIVKIML